MSVTLAWGVFLVLSALMVGLVRAERGEEWHVVPVLSDSVGLSPQRAAALLGVAAGAPAHVVEAALHSRLERPGVDARLMVAARNVLVPRRC